jgi:hypothetical protein
VLNRNGQKIKEFRKSWSRACRETKIGKRLFHDFRRTAVRNMVRAGVPERVAMMVSGQKIRSVFDRYNIVSPDDLKQASTKMEAYLQSQNHGHNLGTVRDFPTKKRSATRANPLISLEPAGRDRTVDPS